MITLEQIKDLQERVAALNACLDIPGKRKEVAAKTEETLAPDFWGDPKAAEAFLKKLSGIKSWITDYTNLPKKALPAGKKKLWKQRRRKSLHKVSSRRQTPWRPWN